MTAPTTLECDVVVVGSGAGGGTAAGVLAAAGLDVVVVEAGGYYDDEDFDGGELSGLRRMYLNARRHGDRRRRASASPRAPCLGGGTVINYSTSFPTPERVREEWASHGVPDFAGDAYETRDAGGDRAARHQRRAQRARRRATRSWSAGCASSAGTSSRSSATSRRSATRASTAGAAASAAGAARSARSTKTWLQDASDAGARILVRTEVEKVIVEGGRGARASVARRPTAHDVTVRARAASWRRAGALHTPALLKRAGLTNKNIGKHLRLHPVGVVGGLFDEEIEPWEGVDAGALLRRARRPRRQGLRRQVRDRAR